MKTIIVSFLLIFLAGCDQQNEIDALKKQMDEMSFEITVLSVSDNIMKNAVFTPRDIKTFMPVMSDMGVFYIRFDNIEKFPTGYKFLFSVLNPYLIAYSDMDFVLKCGIDKKSIVRINNLPRGIWTPVQIVLSPAKEPDVEVCKATLNTPEAKTIALY